MQVGVCESMSIRHELIKVGYILTSGIANILLQVNKAKRTTMYFYVVFIDGNYVLYEKSTCKLLNIYHSNGCYRIQHHRR